MSILKNAVDSIAVGVEDFELNDPRRLPSSVRNFFAGVLLLFKHKLSELSKSEDEALIKKDIRPIIINGKIAWVGKGSKTVDFHEIRQRFVSLGIEVDWKRLEDIRDYRNDIEHYHTNIKPEVVRGRLVDGFLVLRNFVVKQLEKDPRELLGDKTWAILVGYETVYNTERSACQARLDEFGFLNDTAYKWIDAATCDKCGARLIRPCTPTTSDTIDSEFECAVCGQIWPLYELLEIAGYQRHTDRDAQRGVDDPIGFCPECHTRGYDSEEEQCVFCGERGPYICDVCRNPIPVSEIGYSDASICGWCANVGRPD